DDDNWCPLAKFGRGGAAQTSSANHSDRSGGFRPATTSVAGVLTLQTGSVLANLRKWPPEQDVVGSHPARHIGKAEAPPRDTSWRGFLMIAWASARPPNGAGFVLNSPAFRSGALGYAVEELSGARQ